MNLSNSQLMGLAGRLPELLAPFGVNLTGPLADRILVYVRILLQWNEKINLTSVRDPSEIVTRHFGESLFAANVIPMGKGRLADVGTGAGFPGMALKLLSPALDVTLIESNAKKVAFLHEVQRSLELVPVQILRKRLKDVDLPAGELDFVTARAVGGFDELLGWSRTAMSPSGRIILWLGRGDAESLRNLGGWSWEAPVPIPQSRERVILVGYLRNV